ncbi:MAG: dTDP-4-dehydrorhamnose 3,5-epimerase [Dysgonamonadaceae bacterium]|jgi:dTDP-4-dehydrorhamnose 3,5-epimerase|nr:dTDP-4-dehydrorhamnose 3,5-epimerase [Dysgonamonadaceae bacterium]
MEYISTKISGVWILEPKVFADPRGYFMESYKKEEFNKLIAPVNFIQDNESKSSYGVLRGLHFQTGDTAQAKLVRVVQGAVLDVAVDIRPGSPTFGKHVAVELSAENKKQLFVSRGLAHGFLVLSKTAVFNYKVDNHYSPSTEQTLYCFDPELAIQWPVEERKLILSEKDRQGKFLKDLSVL